MAEFSFSVFILFLALIVVIEICHAMWDYSTLVESARRGVRYAVANLGANGNDTAIKNVVVYGSPVRGQAAPALPELQTNHVRVRYHNVVNGSDSPMLSTTLDSEVVVTVRIQEYNFQTWFGSSQGFLGLVRFPMPTVNARMLVESQGANN